MSAPFAPWLESRPHREDGHDHRAAVASAELAHRAGLYYRLGYDASDAADRLRARVAWEYDPANGHHRRHPSLSDEAIGKIVDETYARRPA